MRYRERFPFFALFFGGLFVYFLWPLLLLKKTFVLGDYGIQFYPWSFFYAQQLKLGRLPYWTDLIANGFSLVAEGQIGPYYPLHLLSYRLLPFDAAYTWGIALHFLLGGTGFYLYSRKIGLDEAPATLTAILFTFSSAYGGCFYTTGTLRVLTWLPWAMWAMECLRKTQGRRNVIRWTLLLSAILAQMWTAGFPQLALYGIMYLGILSLLVREDRAKLLWAWLAASCLAICLALPQVEATLQLAAISVRAGESPSFALWGSVPPFAPTSLIYPEWGNLLRVSFYIGILPLLFVVFEMFSKKRSSVSTSHLWLALFFLLLAFGKYNPLYAALVKTFSLTAVRNPSKFLFFTTVSLIAAAGFGMQRWLDALGEQKKASHFKKVASIAGGAMLIVPGVATVFLTFTKDFWGKMIPTIAQGIYTEKVDPAKTSEGYAQILREMLGRCESLFAFDNPHGWAAVFFILASLGVVWAAKIVKWRSTYVSWTAMALVSVNLIYFAHFFGTGFLGNVAAPGISTSQKYSERLKKLLPGSDQSIAEKTELRDDEWFEPSRNLFYGLRHAGGYSPLLVKHYYELTRELGFVDSSLGRQVFSDPVWRREKGLVDFLGVGLLISNSSFENPGWIRVDEMGGRRVYKNKTALPVIYGVDRARVITDAAKRLAHLKSKNFDPRSEVVLEIPYVLEGKAVFSPPKAVNPLPNGISAIIDMPSEGFLVSRIVDIPGVRITVDGVSAKLIRVNHAFCGAHLSGGAHQVRVFYDPYEQHQWEKIAAMAWGLVGVLFLLLWMHPTPKSDY